MVEKATFWRTCDAADDSCPVAVGAAVVRAGGGWIVSLRGRDCNGDADGAPVDIEEDEGPPEGFRQGAMVRWRTFAGFAAPLFICSEDNSRKHRESSGAFPLFFCELSMSDYIADTDTMRIQGRPHCVGKVISPRLWRQSPRDDTDLQRKRVSEKHHI